MWICHHLQLSLISPVSRLSSGRLEAGTPAYLTNHSGAKFAPEALLLIGGAQRWKQFSRPACVWEHARKCCLSIHYQWSKSAVRGNIQNLQISVTLTLADQVRLNRWTNRIMSYCWVTDKLCIKTKHGWTIDFGCLWFSQTFSCDITLQPM